MKDITLIHPTTQTKIKIFYIDFVNRTIDTTMIYQIIDDIYNNIKGFCNKDLFSNLTIEIYDPNHINKHVGLSAGLTYPGKNLIQLSAKHHEFSYVEYFHRLLSHEFFHYYSDNIGFFKDNSFMKKLYISIITPHLNGVSDAEVFAECGMYFFGSSLAKNFFRGKFTPPTQVKGLRDLFIIWSKVENTLKNIEWYRYLTNTFIVTSNIDYSFLEVQIETRNTFFYFDKRLQIVNKNV